MASIPNGDLNPELYINHQDKAMVAIIVTARDRFTICVYGPFTDEANAELWVEKHLDADVCYSISPFHKVAACYSK